MFYSEQDFKAGCAFNLYMGVGIGMVFTVLAEVVFLWAKGIL